MYNTIIKKVVFSMLFLFGLIVNLFANSYVNDMDYVIGDVKQAFIQNKITKETQVENLISGFKAMGVNGIRIPIFAEGKTPNEAMLKYFYNRAMAEGFLIFANPAQSSGGQRIANGILNGEPTSVKDDIDATNRLIYRIMAFASEYRCKWINPFNEDGAPGMAFSATQMNTIYSTLHNNLSGAELIGSCVWGIPAGIRVMNETNISDYITVATTHNLGFNHSQWPTFIAAANKKNLPVWDSEVNHNDKNGTGTRLETALANKVDGLVLYDSWRYINLSNGSINNAGKTVMGLILSNSTNTPITKVLPQVKMYPNPTSSFLNISNAYGSELKVYDSFGKLVLTSIVNSDLYKLEMNGLKTGVYLLRVDNAGVISNYKIVKN